MTEMTFHAWRPLYLRAVMEPLDSSELPRRVREAEMAVSGRIHELRASLPADEERRELGHALAGLRYLRNEKFKRCSGFKYSHVGQGVAETASEMKHRTLL